MKSSLQVTSNTHLLCVTFLPILRFLYKEKNKILDVIVTTGMQTNLYAGIMHFQEQICTHKATAWYNENLEVNLYSGINSATNSLYNPEQVMEL